MPVAAAAAAAEGDGEHEIRPDALLRAAAPHRVYRSQKKQVTETAASAAGRPLRSRAAGRPSGSAAARVEHDDLRLIGEG